MVKGRYEEQRRPSTLLKYVATLYFLIPLAKWSKKGEAWKIEGCYVFPLYFLRILRLTDWAQSTHQTSIYHRGSVSSKSIHSRRLLLCIQTTTFLHFNHAKEMDGSCLPSKRVISSSFSPFRLFFSKIREGNSEFFLRPLKKSGLDGGKAFFGLCHHLGPFFKKESGPGVMKLPELRVISSPPLSYTCIMLILNTTV
jgi:hypothetical protein